MTLPATAVPSGATPLLAPDEPPPFEVLNPEGRAPVLLICDHASRAVPRSLDQLGLDGALLTRHIGWDIGAAEVTRELARRFDAPAVLAGYSRLVIDCNRRLADPSSIPEVSDGVEVPGNRNLAPAQREARASALYRPYHGAIAARLSAFSARGVTPALLSIHSFTPVMAGFARPWHVGVLWDKDPRIAVPVMRNLAADPSRIIGDNEPYSAREPVGYSVLTHAGIAGLPHVAFEIRQDLIGTTPGAATWATILFEALEPILANPDLFRLRR